MSDPLNKQLVLCADDYALNAPVSQGIVATMPWETGAFNA